MEADWSAEIGPDLPRIDASWEAFTDLRTSPQTIDALVEPAQHPALRKALLALNAEHSHVFTTKCDIWTLSGEEIDPDEFEANPQDAKIGFASYIDILERDVSRFASFEFHEQRVREVTSYLRPLTLHHGRVDFVVRAVTGVEHSGYGLTLYAAGCGAGKAAAYAAWQAVLAAAVAATIAAAAHPPRMGE